MTRDDIIEMARDAGFVINDRGRQHQPNCIFHTHHMVDEMLERFAHLVAVHEREECAKVIDDFGTTLANGAMLADAIRARGEK